MLSSLFLNNPFEKPKSPLKQSYWDNRRREQGARTDQTTLEPVTPVFSQAPAEDTFSLTPLPLFESEPPFPLLERAESLAFSLPAPNFSPDSDRGKSSAEPADEAWVSPFWADWLGLSAPEQSPDAPASAAQAQPAKNKAPKKRKASAFSAQEPGGVRNQPRRQAKDDHYLNSLALKEDLRESSQSPPTGRSIQEPLSPRALDAKAGSRTASRSVFRAGRQSSPKTGQPAGSSPWALAPQSAGITANSLRAEVRALLATDATPSAPSSQPSSQPSSEPSLFEPGRPKPALSALAQQRAALKAKKALVLEAFSQGQTDGKTLLTTYQVTPKHLRTWVLEFRRQQEAKGVQSPRLSWSRPQHAESRLKRNAPTENVLTERALKRTSLKRKPEASLDLEEQPVTGPAKRKSQTQQVSQNAQSGQASRRRGELGRFVPITQ
ncbi:hypothetical protein [Vampirovibrio chlorellavorus]|uniref:hypothetical protein n=1 Tax=Vampirovibrio chlorellavorus TaxID=758823 RepID=UPI0026F18E73|nr:hypothetical protein [Vampirovibrio chlorellavorus]